jgi:hypothetical protein
MILYVLLVVLASAVAVSIVVLFRAFGKWRSSGAKTVVLSRRSLTDDSMVSLSSGSGQWSVGYQQGFVDTSRRAQPARSRRQPALARNKNRSAVRKPWGW